MSNPDDELDKSKIDPFGFNVELPDGLLTLEDELSLREYSLGTDLVANLGTFHGRSAVILSFFSKKVITIDSYGGWSDKPQDWKDTPEGVMARLGKYKNIEVISASSWNPEVIGKIGDYTVDTVFFDAEHSVEGINKEFDAWIPKIKIGGHLIFHDYKYQVGQEVFLAVRPAVDALIESGKITKVKAIGWCLIARKDK